MPILFTLYVHDLLSDLKSHGVGCHWDSVYAGASCYANDLVLSPSALRIMINTLIMGNNPCPSMRDSTWEELKLAWAGLMFLDS